MSNLRAFVKDGFVLLTDDAGSEISFLFFNMGMTVGATSYPAEQVSAAILKLMTPQPPPAAVGVGAIEQAIADTIREKGLKIG